jgi:NADH:ubiquinone oxidoreductase subunit 4 (subunit M)
MLNENYLLLLFLMPIITTVVVAVARGKAAPWISTILAGAYFIFVLLGLPVKELSYTATWFGDLTYGLYLDSYSYYLILLSAFLTLLSLVFSLRSIKDKVVAYHALFHALQATVVGSLLCDDLLFFYVFWEAMLIPMYFIIGIWGGARRHYAPEIFSLYVCGIAFNVGGNDRALCDLLSGNRDVDFFVSKSSGLSAT